METMIAEKQQLIELLGQESALLDEILAQQNVVHTCVTKRRWLELDATLEKLQSMSDSFVDMEVERMEKSKKVNLSSDPDFQPYVREVRGKLNKSKIENKVLNEYITTTKKFLQGIFDSVLPQRRNVLYSRTGKIVEHAAQSVVLNQVV